MPPRRMKTRLDLLGNGENRPRPSCSSSSSESGTDDTGAAEGRAAFRPFSPVTRTAASTSPRRLGGRGRARGTRTSGDRPGDTPACEVQLRSASAFPSRTWERGKRGNLISTRLNFRAGTTTEEIPGSSGHSSFSRRSWMFPKPPLLRITMTSRSFARGLRRWMMASTLGS